MYKVIIIPEAQKELDKITKNDKNKILDYIEINLNNTNNPRKQGKELKGNLKGIWRYKVGKYRIISKIVDKQLIILVVNIEKRDQVYKQKNEKIIKNRMEKYIK